MRSAQVTTAAVARSSNGRRGIISVIVFASCVRQEAGKKLGPVAGEREGEGVKEGVRELCVPW